MTNLYYIQPSFLICNRYALYDQCTLCMINAMNKYYVGIGDTDNTESPSYWTTSSESPIPNPQVGLGIGGTDSKEVPIILDHIIRIPNPQSPIPKWDSGFGIGDWGYR